MSNPEDPQKPNQDQNDGLQEGIAGSNQQNEQPMGSSSDDRPMMPASDDAPMMPSANAGDNNSPPSQEEKVYEMQWDCPQCGTNKLLGKTHRFCPNCGFPQDPDKRYFPTEEEKVAVQDHEFVGADKLCGYCGAANSSSAAHCTQCGGPMDETATVNLVQADDQKAADEPPPEPKKMKPWLKWGIIGTAASIIGFCGVFLFWNKTVELEVTNREWVRTIAIEQKQSVRESTWCPAPMGAYSITQRSEQKGTKKIPDGQTCRTVNRDRGDGTFSQSEKCTTKYREEPVYAQKCYYMMDRWRVAQTLESKGTPSQNIVWPNVPPLRTGNSLGSQREGKRTEKYKTNFKVNDGSTNSCEYSAPTIWEKQTDGSRWIGKMGAISKKIKCNELQKL